MKKLTRVLSLTVIMALMLIVNNTVYATASAQPLTITVKAGYTLPTEVIRGQTVSAYFTLTNNTPVSLLRGVGAGYYNSGGSQTINMSQDPDSSGDLCAIGKPLPPGGVCTLKINVIGALKDADFRVCGAGVSICTQLSQFTPVSIPAWNVIERS